MPMQPAKPLVFIVDDVPENIQIALSHLRELDCDFAYATSGEQAIERITASRPQLVLMDVMMPGISGFQTAERLKDVIIEAMGEMAEYRDPETGSHIHRTREYVLLLAETLASRGHFTATLTPDYIILLHKSAPLHDIGKVAIRDSILLKPGKLTPEEFTEMQAHTLFGEEAIANLEQMAGHPTSFLSCAKEIAGSHHEKFDGSGYPRGLAGEAIPLAGRIMAVADVYDALISKRVYKEAMRHEEAMRVMVEGRGGHFDPRVLDAFLAVEPQFQGIASRYID